ncbi:hypothetical protein ACFWBR_25035 [Streptomyces sp. NPDC060006]|uniref:hypothetical protein n=1 Tax=unclassified Streptomyces TaxID=2593676 RepID=UPI0036A8B003
MTATNHKATDVNSELINFSNCNLVVEQDEQPDLLEDHFEVPGSLLEKLAWFPKDIDWGSVLKLTTKTRKIGRMRFVDTVDGTPHATLTNFTIAATKGVDPVTNKPWIYLGIDYYLTSHNYKTIEGMYQPGPLVLRLNFRNSTGGIIYVHNLYGGVSVRCGQNNHHVVQAGPERHVLGWFDIWQKIDWDGFGTVQQC